MADPQGMDTKQLVSYLWTNRNNPRKLTEVGFGVADAQSYFRRFPQFVPK